MVYLCADTPFLLVIFFFDVSMFRCLRMIPHVIVTEGALLQAASFELGMSSLFLWDFFSFRETCLYLHSLSLD